MLSCLKHYFKNKKKSNFLLNSTVCRQHSTLLIDSDNKKSENCEVEKQTIDEMKKEWIKERRDFMATIKKLTANNQSMINGQ